MTEVDMIALGLLAHNHRLAEQSRNGDESITLADFNLPFGSIGDAMTWHGRMALDAASL